MLDLPLLPLAAALIPAGAAVLLLKRGGVAQRSVVLGSSGAAFALCVLSAIPALSPALDALSRLAMVLYSGVAFLTLWATPKRDRIREQRADALLILGGTLAVFATGDLLVMLAGWVVSALPLWRRAGAGRGQAWRGRSGHTARYRPRLPNDNHEPPEW